MNPYEQYQQKMLTTMTQGEMLLKLYDETLRQIDLARQYIQTQEIAEMDKAIAKAQKIIRYLRGNLDFRYSVAGNLAKLYDFFGSELMTASVKKDVKPLDDIRPLISDLRNTFEQCDKIERGNRTSQTAGNVV
ncbi:flagellar export chaperone FliS [Ruminococcaceae bacterium OttesenSCG-928-I18]|nr:flagellar export chaperone FliS [Ruminococcaceae bacterium OttesenSCG-928-I18]